MAEVAGIHGLSPEGGITGFKLPGEVGTECRKRQRMPLIGVVGWTDQCLTTRGFQRAVGYAVFPEGLCRSLELLEVTQGIRVQELGAILSDLDPNERECRSLMRFALAVRRLSVRNGSKADISW